MAYQSSAIDSGFLQNLLSDAQSHQPEVIKRAEQTLRAAEEHAGFGYSLAHFTTRPDVAVGARQLSAILLRKFVRAHWDPDADHFEVKSTQTSAYPPKVPLATHVVSYHSANLASPGMIVQQNERLSEGKSRCKTLQDPFK